MDKQIINLQELLFGQDRVRVDHQDGQESVAAYSFVTAHETNSTITIEDNEAGTGNSDEGLNALNAYPGKVDSGNPDEGLHTLNA